MTNIQGIESLAKIIVGLEKKKELRGKIKKRIQEFIEVHNSDTFRWYEELVFCLLTAYSSALTGLKCVENLQDENALLEGDIQKIEDCIVKEGHRFSRQRAEYIYNTRPLAQSLKKTITNFQDPLKARMWLKNNVKGIGMKEASHFLRNVGYFDLAIIDRHILSNLKEHDLIENGKMSLTPKRYVQLETILKKIAKKVNMPVGEMDLYLWYRKTGAVLK